MISLELTHFVIHVSCRLYYLITISYCLCNANTMSHFYLSVKKLSALKNIILFGPYYHYNICFL